MRTPTILATLLLAATTVHAQPAPPAPPNPSDPAEQAYQEGKRLYDLQEWDQAIAKFKDAYRQRSDAASLFNIAQSFRLKGDCANAISFYKTYKRNFPNAENIAKVDKFIGELEPTCPKDVTPPPTPPPTTTTTPTTATTPPPPTVSEPPKIIGIIVQPPPDGGGADPGHGKRMAGYVVGGVGGAALIGGVLFGVAAHGKANDVSNGTGMWDPSLETSGKRDQTASRILFGVGAAAVITGSVLWFLGHGESNNASPIAIAPLADRGGTVVYSGRF